MSSTLKRGARFVDDEVSIQDELFEFIGTLGIFVVFIFDHNESVIYLCYFFHVQLQEWPSILFAKEIFFLAAC